MRRFLCSLLLCALAASSYAQEGLVTIEPAAATGDQQIKVIYNATLGDSQISGADKVYMHSGVITTSPTGEAWEYVIGNWGSDDGVGQMSLVEGETDLWEITLSPTARSYYGVPDGTNIFRLSMVFRNADGSGKGAGTPGTYSWGTVAGNGDIYVDLAVDSYVQLTSPTASALFVETGETVDFTAVASAEVSSMRMLLDDGSGFSEVASVSSGTSISYAYNPAETTDVTVRVEAEIGGASVDTERTYSITLLGDPNESPIPEGMVKGINYISGSSVVLVLEAPAKEFVYVVGDFTNWTLNSEYLMFKDPDSDLFWLEVDNLNPGQKYVFQYWVEGEIKIGDPYADEVADADNDPFIPSEVFPDIAPYNQSYGPASVLQTAQTGYSWATTENSWVAPEPRDLVIYELLLRDFLESHSYNDLIDTLSYLKDLGINAIELMPVMEFEGNISWGYNPSYFFAVDKYYGTKQDFKRFVEAAHANGIAVIMDMVLNHAFGQNSLVQMYFEGGRPSEDSPWFNQEATHPFNVGYDFNHESAYTQAFVDSVNNYWISEYHVDGFRFDLSKGFTQVNYGTDAAAVGPWSGYDASRIAILKRMAAEIWDDFPSAYVILEHFADALEENELAAEGMVLWRNLNHTAYESLVSDAGDFNGAAATTHVAYMESHDEERITFLGLQNGLIRDGYSTRDIDILLERHKMNAAFFFLLKGPKMLWQFGELGYDIELNDDRLAPKPFPWGEGNLGYYEDELRQYLYDAYAAILNLRGEIPEAINNGLVSSTLNGTKRYLTIDGSVDDVVLAGNFGLADSEMELNFTESGTWFDYFSGNEIDVTDLQQTATYAPGEFHIYTNTRKSDGFPSVVEFFQMPVSIEPTPFTRDTEITIRFDATKASTDGTAGLVGASRVFMYSGVVKDSPSGTTLENIVDGPSAEMTLVEGETDIWEITLTPEEYYAVDDTENIFRLGMYFRNEPGTSVGKGFRNGIIYQAVGTGVIINPDDFSKTDEITITFNAGAGGGELFDAEKVYLHSGVVLTDKAMPTGSDWSHVVGTWGQDNGVGLMSRVPDQPGVWQITLTPSEYYSLVPGQVAYWIAMVFRNADGSVKASIPSGSFDEFYVSNAGDLFYKVPDTEEEIVGLEDDLEEGLVLFPNPAGSHVRILSQESVAGIEVLSLSGSLAERLNSVDETDIYLDISGYPEGLYLLRIFTRNGGNYLRKLVVQRP